MRSTRRARIALLLIVLLVVALGAGVAVISRRPGLTPAEIAAQQQRARLHKILLAQQSAARSAERRLTVVLPTRQGEAPPTATESLYSAPLPAHQVVGFVPYWELSSLHATDFDDASEIVYSSVCPAADGSISTSGSGDCALGYEDLEDPTFVTVVDEAHSVGDRVLLSVETTEEALIETYDAGAATLAPRLAANLSTLVHAHDLDGVNIDFEGSEPADRAGYVAFIKAFTAALRLDDPGGEILLDTYAASAAGPDSFFDPSKLAPYVDALFVEDYSLESPDNASANAPLASPDLGYSVVQSLMQYEQEVPADKIILGVPFYGLDFETSNRFPGASAIASPDAVTYFQIQQHPHAVTWDPASETPLEIYKSGRQWHQIWFDDPTSIALKVALASDLHTAGVGAWAFGMENGDPPMLAALTGGRSPLRDRP